MKFYKKKTMEKNNPAKGYFPEEGWAIFMSSQSNENGRECFQVQMIDELKLLPSDAAAIPFAKLRGYEFKSKENKFEITNIIRCEPDGTLIISKKIQTVNVLEIIDKDNNNIAIHSFIDDDEGNRQAELRMFECAEENGFEGTHDEFMDNWGDTYENGSYTVLITHS